MGRVGRAWVVVLGSMLLLGCGGSTTASGDGGSDAGADATLTDASDASASDAPSDAPLEAGADASCGALAPTACTTCCLTAAGGTGGFELLYNQPCTTCASCGPNVRPCGTNMSPPAGAGCILCLRPSLMQGQPWAMCQQSAQCKAFVECFATCPTM